MENYSVPTGFTVRKTEELATITYVGYSTKGTADSSIKWVVQKVEVVGAITSITYAEGSWDDRATLTYK